MFVSAGERGFETVGFKRLEQIIQRVSLKGADCVLVIGGGKNDERQPLAGKFLQQLEAIHLWHLNIEEEQVRPLTLNFSQGLNCAGAFTYEFEQRLVVRQVADALACQRLIVYNEGANLHTVASRARGLV